MGVCAVSAPIQGVALLDLILPRTDAGVFAQLVVLVVAYAAAAVMLRRQRDWLLLATGIAVLTLGLFGVRALH